MKRYNKIFGALLPALAMTLLASCTDVESIELNRPGLDEQSPELYAKYLQNLNEYKSSVSHKVTYAWFDNSVKAPYSRGQHISDVPDSLDVVSVMYPSDLAEFEINDMAAVRAKGTKVVYTISFDNIRKEHADKVVEGVETGAFAAYLQAELDRLLGYEASFDGIIVEYKGKNPIYMSDEAKAEAKAEQDLFFTAIMNWKSNHADKMLTFQGYPENLIGQTVLSECRHIILVTDKLEDVQQLSLVVRKAMISKEVPTDRFVVAVSTVSIDTTDGKTGYFGGKRAMKEAAYWVTESSSDYTRAGIAIYNIQNDYYNADAIYPCVKEAINIMNPAPIK
ncbi:MAG: glycoside hydrolase family 18 [Bacteroides sp.]|uniref:glycoside hydrolase family 18 n=1 Tax=Bacteroides sp. TaxID=29523 RepID=UPI0026E037F2|nr:glycoside hydrolase family 18 [Bacteroides sp.]MDO5419928.1 glycoside hydrolase family 18 [Bacteroides sp.]